MLVCGFGRDASLRRAVQKAELQEVWLDHVHDRVLLFADGGSNRVQANWSAAIFFDDRPEHAAIHIIEPKRVNLQQVQRFGGDILRDDPICADLGIVTDTAQETQGDARRPARPPRHFADAGFVG